MITKEELERRFSHHPPQNEDDVAKHEAIRETCLDAAVEIAAFIPASREASLAITKLEEAMMWANAALARNREPEDAG
jgi:hypothetical protein